MLASTENPLVGGVKWGGGDEWGATTGPSTKKGQPVAGYPSAVSAWAYSSKRRRKRSSIRLVNEPPEPLAALLPRCALARRRSGHGHRRPAGR